MINYDASSWTDILFRWTGTTIQACGSKVAVAALYFALAYAIELILACNLGYAFGHSYIFGKTLSFLLVFRANASHGRYWEGRTACVEFFAGLRDLATLACGLFKGGHGQYAWNKRRGQDGFSGERKNRLEDEDDIRTAQARTDIVRWSLAMAVCFKIMLRITGDGYYQGEMDEELKWKLDFDRMRLRTLMSKAEFDEVDRALRVEDTGEERRLLWNSGRGEPQVFHWHDPPQQPGGLYKVSMEPCAPQMLTLVNFLSQSVRRHANEPYGYKEKFLPEFIKIVKQMMYCYDQVSQLMTTPLPFPYVNLVRTLLIGYLFSMPFFVNYADGALANVLMPVLTATALMGIDQIGTELENPFGEDVNDLDFQAMIMGLEKEMLRTLLLAGDTRAHDQFVWLPVPKFMQHESTKPFLWYVALQREVAHVNIPRCRNLGGVSVRHVNLNLPDQRSY